MQLMDKVAVVTGGSRGIGKEIASHFLNEGAKVIICSTSNASLQKTAEEFETKFNSFDYYTVNVADKRQVDNMFESIINKYGTIDILVNNAGITADAQLHKMLEEQWDSVIAVNLKGVFNCCKAAVKIMREKQYGKIINMSSVVGIYGNFGQANYAASKAGIIGMSKSMARELGKYNINVNVLAPGYIMTDIIQTVPQKVLQMVKERTSLNRLGTPDEIANVCVFLASDASSFITGAVINADGGYTG